MWSREDAIKRLVELDVSKWGEAERAASHRSRSALTHGLALNTLAHYDVDAVDAEMASDAQAVMTTTDHRILRSGG